MHSSAFPVIRFLCLGLFIALCGVVSAQPGITGDADTGKATAFTPLTPEQRTQAALVLKTGHQQALALLTEAQRTQLAVLVGIPRQQYAKQITAVLPAVKLTGEQQTRITRLIQDFAAAARTIAANGQAPLAERSQKLRAHWHGALPKIMEPLSDEQKRLFWTEYSKAEAARNSYDMTLYAKPLALSDEQLARLATLQAALKTRSDAIRADAQLAEADKGQQLSKAWQEWYREFTQVFTPVQLAQYTALTAARSAGGWATLADPILQWLQLSPDQANGCRQLKEKVLADVRALLTADQQQFFDRFPARQKEMILLQADEENALIENEP